MPKNEEICEKKNEDICEKKNEDICEKIGLTVDEANSCWDYDYVNELCDFQDPGTVLKEIISDKDLTIAQKVYITWIYTYTLEQRKEYFFNQMKAL